MAGEETKILIIDDNKPLAWALKRVLGGSCDIRSYVEVWKDLAEEKQKSKINDNDYNRVIINLEPTNQARSEGIEIINWIRLHEIKIPIIILSFQNLKRIIRENPENSIIVSLGCELLQKPVNMSKLYKTLASIPLSDKDAIKKFINLGASAERILGVGKHSVVNEFGAVKLLEGAYLADAIDNAKYNTLRQEICSPEQERKIRELELRYKWSGQSEGTTGEPRLEQPLTALKRLMQGKKVLLVDDEYEKGWETVLKGLFFSEADFKPVKSCEEAKRELNLEVGSENFKKVPYDLILLDLRLTDQDQQMKGYAQDYSKLSSWQLLKDLRERDLGAPVILFTASDKSYIFDKFETFWIAGKFIKEFPSGDVQYPVLNFCNFVKLLTDIAEHLQEKREIWEKLAHYLDKEKPIGKVRELLEKGYQLLRQELYNLAVIHFQIVVEQFIEKRFPWFKLGKPVRPKGPTTKRKYNHDEKLGILDTLLVKNAQSPFFQLDNFWKKQHNREVNTQLLELLEAWRQNQDKMSTSRRYKSDLCRSAWQVYELRNRVVHNAKELEFDDAKEAFNQALNFLEEIAKYGESFEQDNLDRK